MSKSKKKVGKKQVSAVSEPATGKSFYAVGGIYPQQSPPLFSPEQPQVGGVPFNAPWMTACAQPTPAATEIASVGQLREHAPHSMQASRSATLALSSRSSNTAWGHTSRHRPHPVHLPASMATLETPFK